MEVGWLAFLLLAMLAAPVWSLLAWVRRKRVRAALPLVDARVVAASIEERTGRFGVRPVWRVEYELGGRRHHARCDEADSRWTTGSTSSYVSVVRATTHRRLERYPVGSTIPVRVNPDSPDRVTLARGELDTQGLVLVLGMIAAVLVAFGLLYLLPG